MLKMEKTDKSYTFKSNYTFTKLLLASARPDKFCPGTIEIAGTQAWKRGIGPKKLLSRRYSIFDDEFILNIRKVQQSRVGCATSVLAGTHY